jgi:7-cyano-7-deazaguanine synthase
MERPDHLPVSPATGLGSAKESLAVLVSGGLDSAILLGEALRAKLAVYPLYVRQGLFWEDVELHYLQRFLEAIRCTALQPLAILEMPAQDIYDSHWSITGQNVPGPDTPDEAVFLPGRNVLLLGKAFLWCHLHLVPAVALALLEANPFPDATPSFFDTFQELVNESIEGKVQILRPYARLRKCEVMRRGQGLPLQFTFSCIRPLKGKHCGRCNKCAERRQAFAEAGLGDPTEYSQDTKTGTNA